MFFALKDPNSLIDYTITWDDWLATGDSITDSQWYITGVDSSLYATSSGSTSDSATIWLAGGTATYIYTVTNRITTGCNRRDDRSIRITVREE